VLGCVAKFAICCSVWPSRCFLVQITCCSVLQCVAVCCSILPTRYHSPDAVCCRVLSVLHIQYIDVLQAKEAML